MKLVLHDELPFVTVTVVHRGASIQVPDVLVDTGSASTLLNADLVADIGIRPGPTDRVRTLRGVGGHEFVFATRVDRLEIAGHGVDGFEVEIGAMDYGFDFGGILGMDSLIAAGVILNLRHLTLDFSTDDGD